MEEFIDSLLMMKKFSGSRSSYSKQITVQWKIKVPLIIDG
jgi:hypothetical protein